MNHYRQIEKEVSVTNILLQLRILKGLAKAKMTKQEWETKKIQHGYPDLEHMMRERLEKKLNKDEKVVVPEIRRNSVASQLDQGIFKKIELQKYKTQIEEIEAENDSNNEHADLFCQQTKSVNTKGNELVSIPQLSKV